MRLLFLGDVVGRSARNAVTQRLPGLVADHRLDFVVVNGENAAGGFGITEEVFRAFLDAGADVVTTGNHVFDQREALIFASHQERFLRPANYPAGTPGRGAGVFLARNGARVLVVNVMGRVFMDALDDPFAAVDRELAACPLGEQADAVIVDVHAEASSEKQAMGHHLDGRATLVVGTHTHVPTSDYRILPGGTAYQTDVGMCGDYNSVIGMDKEEPLRRFLTKVPGDRFTPAQGPATLAGIAVEIDDATGLATAVAPFRLGGALSETLPPFWAIERRRQSTIRPGEVGDRAGHGARPVGGYERRDIGELRQRGRAASVRHSFDERLKLLLGDAERLRMKAEDDIDRRGLGHAGCPEDDRPYAARSELRGEGARQPFHGGPGRPHAANQRRAQAGRFGRVHQDHARPLSTMRRSAARVVRK